MTLAKNLRWSIHKARKDTLDLTLVTHEDVQLTPCCIAHLDYDERQRATCRDCKKEYLPPLPDSFFEEEK
jgi:hypothetical protein